MAVPKRKTSRARRDRRRAHWKGKVPTYSECPHCHRAKLPHVVCHNCGYYRGREAVELE